MWTIRFIAVFLLALTMRPVHAQVLPEFNMSDTVVTICKGILLDSEAGPGGNLYGNNEDFVFTIDAGSTITLIFTETFCLEQGYDFLTFHNGPSINSPQIGPSYSGITAPPPIVATSGQLTIHFVSDPTVAYCGFEAQWTSEVEPPVPPVMTIPTAPLCMSASFGVHFSYPIPCDSIVIDAVTISGPNAPVVTGATATGCVAGETQNMQLQVTPPFDRNCPYDVAFTIGLRDRCDSLWYFTLNASTQVVSCPIAVEVIAAHDTICAGGCTTLIADVNGCSTYTYAWSNGLASVAGPITVCPGSTTTYSVVVTETGTGMQASGSATVEVLDPQIIGAPLTVCQSLDAFTLNATPGGGWWGGAGILDSLAGVFDPDTAGPGMHVLTYGIPGGCSDQFNIVVDSMDAGVDEAACPGTAPFLVSGNSPIGGTWSGPFITANGLFDPSTVGAHVVTYTAGSCSDTKTIHVDTIAGPLVTDTVCQSEVPFAIPISPFGGIWSGAGIIDTLYGIFDPDEAEGGTHLLTYTLHGCYDQFEIHVKPVDIGSNRSACPAQSPFLLTPAAIPPGGGWNGQGITDPVNGMYDPVQAGNGWDQVTYAAPNGCVDTIRILVGYTELNDDTLFFCSGNGPLVLNRNTTGRTPWDGSWSGAGIGSNSDGDPIFDPNVAGIGMHLLHYEANGCADSMFAIVHPISLGIAPMTVCSSDAPFLLAMVPPGAVFSGPGVQQNGLFDPMAAGSGSYTIHYDTPAACSDSVLIEVLPYQQASISGVASVYCSNDVDVTIDLQPPGGVFSGMSDTLFNPSTLVDGTYTLTYTVGSGACASVDTLVFTDHPALTTELVVGNNPICEAGASTLEVLVNGGEPLAPITFYWSDGLFPVATQSVSPSSTHTYSVTTVDGCSDPVTDTVTIIVHPPFQEEFVYSGMQCYDEPGFVAGSVNGTGTYTFSWDTSPQQLGDSIALPAGHVVQVHVVNDQTGCAHDTLVRVPSWPAITALFSPDPYEPCVPWEQRDLTFIDLSNNAVGGFWTIDGDTIPYTYGVDPAFEPSVSGYFNVELVVWNEGGCTDTLAMEICIQDSEAIFIPDAFSPNGDGMNDVLFVRGPSISTMEFQVYDRWGNMLFRSSSVEHGWNGGSTSERSPSGVYLYVLKAALQNGEKVERSGNITLVR